MSVRYDWEEAFAFYVAQGTGRTLASVSERLGATPRTVERAAHRYKWQERVAEIDRQAREKADAQLIRDRAERITDTLRVIDAARTRFAGQLSRSDFRLTGSDFVGLVKLEALLEGEATDRISIPEVREFVSRLAFGVDELVESLLTTHLANGKRAAILADFRARFGMVLEQAAGVLPAGDV